MAAAGQDSLGPADIEEEERPCKKQRLGATLAALEKAKESVLKADQQASKQMEELMAAEEEEERQKKEREEVLAKEQERLEKEAKEKQEKERTLLRVKEEAKQEEERDALVVKEEEADFGEAEAPKETSDEEEEVKPVVLLKPREPRAPKEPPSAKFLQETRKKIAAEEALERIRKLREEVAVLREQRLAEGR